MLQSVGGDVSVDVEPGSGSTFTLFLPRAEQRAEQESELAAEQGSLPPPARVSLAH